MQPATSSWGSDLSRLPPPMGRKGHPFSPRASWRTPTSCTPGRASKKQGHYQDWGWVGSSLRALGRGAHTHTDRPTRYCGHACICTGQSSTPHHHPPSMPVHATQPGEALLPADGALRGGQAGRWEGVAGGRQGPWRAQAPPGWVQGQGSCPPPTLSVTAPWAPRRTSLQIHSLPAVYSGHRAQTSTASTAVQLPPARTHRYTRGAALLCIGPALPLPGAAAPHTQSLGHVNSPDVPAHHSSRLPAQPHRRHTSSKGLLQPEAAEPPRAGPTCQPTF